MATTTEDLKAATEQLHELLPFLEEAEISGQFCTYGQMARTIDFLEREIARRGRAKW